MELGGHRIDVIRSNATGMFEWKHGFLPATRIAIDLNGDYRSLLQTPVARYLIPVLDRMQEQSFEYVGARHLIAKYDERLTIETEDVGPEELIREIREWSS